MELSNEPWGGAFRTLWNQGFTGPAVDTLIDLDLPGTSGFTRLYIVPSEVQEIARLCGYVPAAELEQARAEIAALMEKTTGLVQERDRARAVNRDELRVMLTDLGATTSLGAQKVTTETARSQQAKTRKVRAA